MVRKIQGKGKSASVNHLKKNNTHVTSKKDIANTLADNFSEKSSKNYSAKFRKIKHQQEKQKLKFTSDNTETYNSKFSLTELTDALSKAHDSFPGPDDIHYQLLKHLPSSSCFFPRLRYIASCQNTVINFKKDRKKRRRKMFK